MNHRGEWVRAWVLTVAAAVVVVAPLPAFFRWLGERPGRVPWEPLHPHLPAVDLSVPLFVVLYGAILFGIAKLVRHPGVLLRTAWAYLLMLVLRMVSMALFTLEPPAGMIPLRDPVTLLFYPDHQPFAKDLFFSGHTATVFLFLLAVPGRGAKVVLGLATVLVAAAVVVQRFHWTVDVLAAPAFVALAWRGAGLLLPHRAGASGRPDTGGV